MRISLALMPMLLCLLLIVQRAEAYVCDATSTTDTGWVYTSEWCPCPGVSCETGPQRNKKRTTTVECLYDSYPFCALPCLQLPFYPTTVDWECDTGLCTIYWNCTLTYGDLVTDCLVCT
jgi:hypothetical protein